MLKPERVTFSADDDKFHQFPDRDQLNSFLKDSLVHYSTDFKNPNQKELTSIKHSTSLDELSAQTMSSQQQQQHQQQEQLQQQQTEHEPPASAPPSLISEQVPVLNENNLHQFDALTLQQFATGSQQTSSSNNTTDENLQTSPLRSTTLADVQKEIDRVRQMKYGRTHSSPTSSLCSRLSINPFNGSNNNIDISSLSNPVHFTEQSNSTNRLPFSSTYITSIPESIVPASASSSTNDNHFIPIHNIESPSLEDREVFETFHSKQSSIPGVAIRQTTKSLNRNISTSETDLIASLHRSVSKQALDTQSEHGTTCSGTSDEMIFVEWDKERSLFQDYINSLRTEIRVLLQERAEYQRQMETINNNLSEHKRLNLSQIHSDETKYDLLQKSLEEKNLVLEQLQKEYEAMKDKNTNLTRKISNLRCDAKTQTGVIDELKQKIAELTVDIQNHVLVKRRLEVSMMNLENDCKLIDAERIRVTNDVKDLQLSKQDLEKLLQQANVQIAEQGSTIEMLRSDNIQIRSQLSATQRRMLQEKQQVMDYLRQIENDLIEKEQIKQRESLLRKDFEKLQQIQQHDRQVIEQLNLQIDQDKQKITQLEQERVQLLKTIQNQDDKQTQVESELDTYKSATKRLYSHFKIPFDSIQTIDQLIPMIEDRYRTEQISHARIHNIPLVQSSSSPEIKTEQNTEEIRQLEENLATMTVQLKQLEEANQAWQQYQQNQLIVLRDRLKLTDMDNSSFDDIVQQIENRFTDLNNQVAELENAKNADVQPDPLENMNIRVTKDTQTEDVADEVQQLREDLATLTAQCVQLDEANRAWQSYHQTQVDSFTDKLRQDLSLENSLSLDDIAQQIQAHIHQIEQERDNISQQLQTLEKLNSESTNNDQAATLAYLNQQIDLLKQQNEQLETEKYILNHQIEQLRTTSSLAIQKQIHPTQIYEAQIHNVSPVQSASPSINENEQEIQQLRQNITLLTNQCAQLDEANRAWLLYQQTQTDSFRNKLQHHLPIDENIILDQIPDIILNQLDKERQDFTQQYHALETINDQLRSESEANLEMINDLNQQLTHLQDKYQQANDALQSQPATQPVDEEEVRQLRENLVSLTSQLDATNRAWQEYQQTQADLLRNQLQNHFSLDSYGSFDEIVHEIIDQVTKERDDFGEKYEALERVNNDLRSNVDVDSIRETYMNKMNELNDELLTMREAYERVDSEKQALMNELEHRANESGRRSVEKISSEPLKQLFAEVPIHRTGIDSEEVQQLRESLATLSAQCAQLDEANRAWQMYQQSQADNFRSKLQDYVPMDESTPFDQIPELIIDQLTRERLQTQETLNQPLSSVSTNDLESIRQSYMNTVNELTQELLALKEAYAQLDNEKQALADELEKRPIQSTEESGKQATENVSEDVWNQSFKEVPLQTSNANAAQDEEELPQLREDFVRLTTQCAQLEEANRAWQSYQQTQMDTFRNCLQDCLLIEDNLSLDQIAQQIVEQITKEREASNEKYIELEKVNSNLQSELTADLETIKESYTNTVNELNQELLAMKEAYEHLDNEKQQLADEVERRSIQKVSSEPLKQRFEEVPIHRTGVDSEEVQQLRESVASLSAQCAQLDEANRAWQMYQQSQADNFRSKLQDYVPMDESTPFDQIPELIIDQLTKERSETKDKIDEDHPSELTENLEAIRESYMNTVNELTQELLALKEAYAQLDNEKQALVDELEKRPIQSTEESGKQATENVSEDVWNQAFKEVPLQTSNASAAQDEEEVEQLREDFVRLTTQCAQLEEANRAWQSYQQTQMDTFRNCLQDCLLIEDNLSLDQIAQQIVEQITKEREASNEKYIELEKVNSNLQSELTADLETIKESYTNTVNELNQELLAMKEAYEQLDNEKQALTSELERRSVTQTTNGLEDNLTDEISLQTNPELEQLREEFAVLTSQYAELHEANQAWEQFHQSQLNKFRQQIQDYISIDENFSFDQIVEQIINHLTKEQDQTFIKDQYDELMRENDTLLNQIENLESTNKNLLEQQTEMSELRESLQSLTTQFSDKYQSWGEFQHRQFDQLKSLLPFSNKISLEDIIEEIISYINQLKAEIEFYKEKEQQNNSIEDELVSLRTANHAWQTFYNNQIDLLKENFSDFIPLNDNLNFEEIIQLLVTNNTNLKDQQQISTSNNEFEKQTAIDLLKTNLEILTNENEQLKEQLYKFEKKAHSYERPQSPFVSRRTPIQDVPIHRLTPVQSASSPLIGEDELQQLRTNLSTLTVQCAQLDEANRAWQIYHQNQLEIFRQNLQDWIFLDENLNLEQIAQQIIRQFDQLVNNQHSTDFESLNKQLVNYQLNESILSQNLEQLNQKLSDVHHECEEFRENNAKLILTQQQIEQQNQQLKAKVNEIAITRVDSPREKNIGIHNIDQNRDEEIQQLRNNLAAALAQCAQLDEANRAWQTYQQDQIASFRHNLQEHIPSLSQSENSSLDVIGQQILNYLQQLNSEKENLLRQNDSLKDEIQIQKYNSERPGSADSSKRMYRRLSQEKHLREAQIHNVSPVQSASPSINENEQEIQQLRQNITLLTNQCAQLDEANRAWLLYQQTQTDSFRNKLQHHLPIDENIILDQIPDIILNQLDKERQDFTQQYHALETINDQLRSESEANLEMINDLNQQLTHLQDKYQQANDALQSQPATQPVDEEEVRQLRENLVSLTSQLDATNRAWQEYQQTQADLLRNQLQNHFSLDSYGSFDEIVHEIIDQVTKERDDFGEKYEALERVNNDLRSNVDVDSIRETYMNKMNELNDELLTMREAYERVDSEKQALMNELEHRANESGRRSVEKISSEPLKQLFAEVPIHRTGIDSEEVQQLRESLATLSAQCAQLDEANRAWQMYQQSQADNFRSKLQDYVPMDESTPFDQIPELIIDQLTRERLQTQETLNQPLSSVSTNDLESIRQSYMNTVNELTQELLALKEAYAQLDNEKQALADELEKRPIQITEESGKQATENVSEDVWNQAFKEVPLQTSNASAAQDEEELRQLREDFVRLTTQCAQLEEANRAWQSYQQTQMDTFRNCLQDCLLIEDNLSLDQIAQQIVEQITNEREASNEKYIELEKVNSNLQSELTADLETIKESYTNTVNELNQELLAMKEAYEQLDNEKQQLADEVERRSIQKVSSEPLKQRFEEVPIHRTGVDSEEVQQLRESVASLSAQCAQLDEANRAWQMYQQSQADNFRSKLQDYVPMDESTPFDQIPELIIDQLVRERANSNFPSSAPMESTEESDKNTVYRLNEELLALKEAYDQLNLERQALINELEQRTAESDTEQSVRTTEIVASNIWKQPFREVPIHTTGADVEKDLEELQQLRETVANLTAQCIELNEANQVWKSAQENQLNDLRAKLDDYLELDDINSLDDIAQKIVEHLSKERQNFSELQLELTAMKQYTEQTSIENADELNRELLNLKSQYEELEKLNKQLLIEREDLINQLNDRSLVVGHHTTTEPNPFDDDIPIETKDESELQSSTVPSESDKLHQIRSNLVTLTESTQNELNSFRKKLQNWIFLHPNSTLDEMAQQLHIHFEQQIPAQTSENQTQTRESIEQIHIAIETIPLTHEHQHTQIDPIEMLDQQIQTESLLQLWSLSNDDHLLNSNDDDDHLRDYIDEIASLSSLELTNRLKNDCEQILFKQNISKDIYSQLDLTHLTLITIYSLYQQHLTDDAKQLYNETLIRALKQEYELINNEKNDYMDRYLTEIHLIENKYHQLQNQYDDLLEHNELERLHAKQSMNDSIEKYEVKLYNYHQENERLKVNINHLQENSTKIHQDNYYELNQEYQQLRLDYDELINKNELLLNYNSEMYQRKLQTDDVDVQCNLFDENQNLKQSLLQNIETNTIRPILLDNSVQDIPTETNDWDNDMPSDQQLSLSSSTKQTIDNETQTDEQTQEKLIQINNKLKRALQTIKDKIHQTVSERPELFSHASDDTIERLDRLISTIGDQTALIELLQNERHQTRIQLENQRSKNVESPIDSNRSMIDEYKQEIEQLQYLVQERDNLIRQKEIHSSENQREIQELREQIDQLQQLAPTEPVSGPSEEEIQLLKDEIEEKSEELKDLTEKYFALSSQLESNADLQTRLIDYESLIENLTKERSQLLEEIRNHTSSVQSGDGEKHGNEQQLEKLVKINTKLKRVLQTFKEKLGRLVNERPELFTNVGEETSERLDHLISTVEHQATQLEILQSEHNETEEQLRNEIQELQSSVEAYRYQIENERPVRSEQLVFAAPPPPSTSESDIDEYEKQIKQLQQKVSQYEDERQLLRERLNEVEVEFSKTNEDRSSTLAMYEEQLQSLVQERNALVEQHAVQSAESERQLDKIQETLNAEIQSLKDEIEEKSEELKDLTEKYFALSSQLESNVDLQARLIDYESLIENLTKERSQLLEEIRNHTSSVQSGDGEKHGSEQQLEKLVKINTKLKRVLQTFKEKLGRLANERPELFTNVGEETSERLDHLISTVEHQATQLEILQSEHNQTEEQLRNEIQELQSSVEAYRYQIENERPVRSEQLVSAAPPPSTSESDIDEYEKQIKQLQQKVSQYEDERQLLRERLNEVEVEFSKANEDRSSTLAMYEEQLQSLVQERNALVEQQAVQSAERQREIDEFKEQLDQLQQAEMTPKEDILSLQTVIQQQSEELKDINEKYFNVLSQLKDQDEVDREKKALEEQLNNYKHQLDNLLREHDNLLEEVRHKASSIVEPTDNEKQSVGEQQHDKLAKVNTKLKRVLQTFKEKLSRLVNERPELFTNVGEETSERLDHLIATVEHQATQIDMLQSEHNETEGQLRNEIFELQNSLETCQSQLENERSNTTAQLLSSTASPDDPNQSQIQEYEEQIKQLQQKLSQYDDERQLLHERLNEVEEEFNKANEDRSSTLAMYEEQLQSLVQERNALIEQQALQSAENEREIDELKEKLEQLKQSTSNEDVQSLKDEIEEKSEELKDLTEKYFALSSQLESNADLQTRLIDYESQIENLTKERSQLLEEIRNHTSSVQSGDGEKHGNEQQLEKLVKINTKLKRVLQTFKEKLSRLANERPELFTNVGEEISERLDHLIFTVEHQATQLGILQSEHNQTEEQLRNEIQELQSSVEAYRYQIENERPVRSEQLVFAAPPPSTSESDIDEYEKQIKQLQRKLSENEDERQLLRERLNEVELELRKVFDTQSFEEKIQSLNAIIEQQTQQLTLLDEKYVAVQAEFNQEKEAFEAQLNDYENRIENLTQERSQLLEEIKNNASSSVQSNEDDKLTKMNTKLKRALQTFKEKMTRLVNDQPELFNNVGEETSERLDHLISTVEHQATQLDTLRNEIQELQNSLNLSQQQIENSNRAISSTSNVHKLESNTIERTQEIPLTQSSDENQWNDWSEDPSRTTDVKLEHQEPSVTNQLFDFFKNVASPWTEEPTTNDWNNQQSSLQIIKTKLQQLSLDYPEYFPNSTSNILDNLDQLILTLKTLQSSYNQLSQQKHQVNLENISNNSIDNNDNQKSLEQRISRRVFEQEILAWSKESEQLKQFVKQIQIENKKLKDIILKFERIIHDYMHENERLKQDNQQLSLLSYSFNIDESSTSDTDICYLTLKWLTYEVAQRTTDNHEQTLLMTEDNDPYLRQRLSDTERQLKTIRIQNQKLKKQLEIYSNQLRHIQQELNIKYQELSLLKIENDRLHTSETQYRLEVDRLKVDLQCEQIKFQQFERELNDLKLEKSNFDDQSSNNLHELLQLKERELNALKDKLDYTIQVHQLELQEAIKSNQFSLDNVQRFEQLDQQHQVKRNELERRLGQICQIVRPLIDNQDLFKEESIINIDELERLIIDTEAEQRVINSLGPIRDCLGLLENQMKELQQNLIENHVRRSRKTQSRLESEHQWDMSTLQETDSNDIRLCLDDVLDEILVRTTGK